MKLTIDTEENALVCINGTHEERFDLYSDAAFDTLSTLWVKVGWNQKYTYTFTWLGRPIIQLPEDLIRTQEVIYQVRPDIIVETGVAHGGSLIFYASLFEAMQESGRVIGVDIEIRPHNRMAIETHPLARRITLIEGDSTAPKVIAQVHAAVGSGKKVMVFLDSNHSCAHVISELRAYSPLVSVGSYIVATDGLMRDLAGVPRGQVQWKHDNPARAAEEFAAENPQFCLKQPAWAFNESRLTRNVTHWPSAWLHRIR